MPLNGKNLLIGFIALLSISVVQSCREKETALAVIEPSSDTTITIYDYHADILSRIYADTLVPVSGKIKRNQFLSEILDDYGISYYEIDKLTRNSGDIFDVRNMKAGADYTIFTGVSDSSRALYMLYEHDPVNYYILNFTND